MKFDPNTFSEEDKEIYEWLEKSIKEQFSKYYNIFKKCDIKIVDNIFINFLSGLSEDEINKYSSEITWISNKWLKNLINEINFKILNLLKNKWTIPYIDEKIVYELLEYPITKEILEVLSDKYPTLESKNDDIEVIKKISKVYKLDNLHYKDIENVLEYEWIGVEDLEEYIWLCKDDRVFKWLVEKHFPDLHIYLEDMNFLR